MGVDILGLEHYTTANMSENGGSGMTVTCGV